MCNFARAQKNLGSPHKATTPLFDFFLLPLSLLHRHHIHQPGCLSALVKRRSLGHRRGNSGRIHAKVLVQLRIWGRFAKRRQSNLHVRVLGPPLDGCGLDRNNKQALGKHLFLVLDGLRIETI